MCEHTATSNCPSANGHGSRSQTSRCTQREASNRSGPSPSRLAEQSWDVQGAWAGWSHHHWLIEIHDGRIDFLFKPHVLHAREEFWFPRSFYDGLTDEQRVETLWWDGSFDTREVLLFEPGALDADLAGFVTRHMPERPPSAGVRDRLRGALRRG